MNLSCLACGKVQYDSNPGTAAGKADAGSQVLWTYGGGSEYVYDIVQERDGTVYAGLRLLDDAGTGWSSEAVVALATATNFGLLVSWGHSVSRVSPSGAVLWTTTGSWDAALGPDGTSYIRFIDANSNLVTVQAISSDGQSKWSVAVGGNGDYSPCEAFNSNPVIPSIAASGEIYAASCGCGGGWCAPCVQGAASIIALNPSNGTVAARLPADPTDAGDWPNAGDEVTFDSNENAYYGYGFGLTDCHNPGDPLASATIQGKLRWTTDAPALGPFDHRLPGLTVLAGSQNLVANSTVNGFIELSPEDGTVVSTTAISGQFSGLYALIDGGLFMGQVSLQLPNQPSTSSPGSSFIASNLGPTGTGIVNRQGNVVWFEPGMDASTAIPASGVVYGIESGKLVAVRAPINGLDLDPGQ